MTFLPYWESGSRTGNSPYIRQRCPDDSPGWYKESRNTCGRTNKKMTRFINCNAAYKHRSMSDTCHKLTGTTQFSICFILNRWDPTSQKPPESLLDPPDHKLNVKSIVSVLTQIKLKVSEHSTHLPLAKTKQNKTKTKTFGPYIF